MAAQEWDYWFLENVSAWKGECVLRWPQVLYYIFWKIFLQGGWLCVPMLHEPTQFYLLLIVTECLCIYRAISCNPSHLVIFAIIHWAGTRDGSKESFIIKTSRRQNMLQEGRKGWSHVVSEFLVQSWRKVLTQFHSTHGISKKFICPITIMFKHKNTRKLCNNPPP